MKKDECVVPRSTGGKGFLKEGTGHANAWWVGEEILGFISGSFHSIPTFFAKLSPHFSSDRGRGTIRSCEITMLGQILWAAFPSATTHFFLTNRAPVLLQAMW